MSSFDFWEVATTITESVEEKPFGVTLDMNLDFKNHKVLLRKSFLKNALRDPFQWERFMI